jgi:hypothetical protein
MTRRARPLGVATATAATAIALAGCGLHNPDSAGAPLRSATTVSSERAGTPDGLPAAEINRQDHPPASLERSQAAAIATRPMLAALPITTAGVTIQIAGLAPDGHTTILTITSGHGHRQALAVYRRELRLYGDSGRAYEAEVQP